MDNIFKSMQQKRLGLFVHYGVYSALAGVYRGREIESLGEWIQRRAEIPISEYEVFAKELFRPGKDFAKNLVRSAKEAGAKYIVLTSKHHDGFCLFKSEADGYNSYEYLGRDICMELSEACRAEGLGLGFYYSHALDWHEKNGAGNYTLTRPDEYVKNRNFWDFPEDNIDFDEYFRRKCLPQVRELLTNYGKLECIWFDYPHDISREQSAELRALVKELQPDCLINSRIGHGLCDYYSLADNGLPSTPARVPTECLITLNDTWGYKSYDRNYKSCEAVIEILCRSLTAGATLLVNVGPMGDGSLTPETVKILKGLGEWTSLNAEAVYGDLSPSPFKTIFPWGSVCIKGRDMFLYPKETGAKISISCISTAPVSVKLLSENEEIPFEYRDGVLIVHTKTTDLIRPVYKVSFAEEPMLDGGLVVDSTRGSLPVTCAGIIRARSPESTEAIPHEYDVEVGKLGTKGTALTRIDTIQHWRDCGDSLVWEAKFAEVGKYEAEVVASLPSFETCCQEPEDNVPYTLWVGNTASPVLPEVKCYENANKTNSCNARFVKSAGSFTISAPGVYRVKLSKETDRLGLGLSEIRFIKK